MRIRWGAAAALAMTAAAAFGHAIGGRDAAFVAAVHGPAIGPFIYLGAKHMVTGYDHLLFLAGVVFFLRSFRDILLYVSLFSLGHSITLLSGALIGFGLDAHLVDAVIGLSVAYKAFDNLGGFERTIGRRPDPRLMVLGFGLIHGLGLATKLEELKLHREGLAINLVSFNVGVELGQIVALAVVVGLLALLRGTPLFDRLARPANWAIMAVGLLLIGYQLAGYEASKTPRPVAAVAAGAPSARSYATPFRGDVIEIPLAATGDPAHRDEVEYKVHLKEGSSYVYSWTVTGIDDPEFFYTEFHGHTLEAGKEMTVAEYRKATGTSDNGVLTAPFAGVHGWYFQNQSNKPVTVSLRIAGFYELIPDGQPGNEFGFHARRVQ